MGNLRKKSEVWEAVAEKCPEGMSLKAWKATYEGVKAALTHIGLELTTTKEEYDAMETPRCKRGGKLTMAKKD